MEGGAEAAVAGEGRGLEVALACDIRIASESATFRGAGINNGLTAAELGLSRVGLRAKMQRFGLDKP